MKLTITIVIISIFVALNCNSQVNYNRPCFTSDLAIGNGLYGIGSLKIGTELPMFNYQKIGMRIGAGLDISEKIGFGVLFSPYQFKKWDIIMAFDLTRMFGAKLLYHNESKNSYSEDLYSFDNTNLIIPSIAIRFPGAKFFTFHLTSGWAFGLNDPNITLVSGLEKKESLRNINNRLLGGYRIEFGGTFRIRKWN